ncbi:hypothetical protein [Micromonospora arborensis]|uniref:hypothetical protein n=1 Tax=Micromonospora arborensis TaxID=2116518 RepID=UPI00371DB122
MSDQDLNDAVGVTPGVEEDPETVTGEPVDESQVLGDAAYLADPAEHQEVA